MNPTLTGQNTGIMHRQPSVGFPEFAAVIAVIALYSYLTYYLFDQGITYLQPNYVYFTIYLLAAFTYATNANARRALAPHAALLGVFALLVVLMSAQFVLLEIGTEGMSLFYGRLHFFLTVIAMTFILTACARLDVVIWMFAAIIVVGCTINLAEFFLAGSTGAWMSNVPGRAAGFYENSNDSAMFLAMGIPLVAMNFSTRGRWLFYFVTLVGIYVTFSRGGLLAWAFFFAISESFLERSKGWRTRAVVIALLALTVVLMLSLFSGDIAKILTDALWPYLDANTTARIEFLSYDSTEERMAVLQRGWEAFEAAPLFGQGIGYTYAWDFPVSVHNMMLLMLAEMGILGGVWYLLFLASLAQYPRPFGLLACSVILVTGLFTHNHLERPAVAIVIALYAVSACQPSRNKSKGARQSAFEYVD